MRRPRVPRSTTTPPHTRMSKWQELVLFALLMLVLLVLIYLGMRA
jgi:uncharacterized membrane protein